MLLLNKMKKEEKMKISPKLKRHIAFTLAEVLITLGIIGIVAEMTIPTLIHDTQEREFKVAWKKVYSTFSQAYLTMKYENTIDWQTNHVTMKNSFKPYFKITADCDTAGDTCWRTDATLRTRNLANSAYLWDFSGRSGIVTADGINIIFNADSTTNGWIIVDVNGDKKPNVLGRDVFGMRFTPVKSFAFNQTEMGTCNPPAKGAVEINYIGLGCSEYYLFNE